MFASAAYSIGQVLGVLLLVAIGFGIYRDVIKKKGKGRDDNPPPPPA